MSVKYYKEMAEIFKQYARNYNVGFTKAARDRDWPMTEHDLGLTFQMAHGRLPSQDEMREMSPDSQDTVNDAIRRDND